MIRNYPGTASRIRPVRNCSETARETSNRALEIVYGSPSGSFRDCINLKWEKETALKRPVEHAPLPLHTDTPSHSPSHTHTHTHTHVIALKSLKKCQSRGTLLKNPRRILDRFFRDCSGYKWKEERKLGWL